MKAWIAGTLLFCVAQGLAQSSPLPKVYFESAGSLDLYACHAEAPVTEDMLDILVAKVPEFEHTWQAYGPDALKVITNLTGHEFEPGHNELNIGLFLCNDKGSLAFPALVNVVPYFDNTRVQFPKQVFTETVLAIMMIRYMMHHYPNLEKHSKLLQRYENESDMVKNHLHIDAMIKYAYLALHKEDDLEEAIKAASKFKNPGVARAWEIINNEIGYQPFIDEILAAEVGGVSFTNNPRKGA
jgi:hypothetical protein